MRQKRKPMDTAKRLIARREDPSDVMPYKETKQLGKVIL